MPVVPSQLAGFQFFDTHDSRNWSPGRFMSALSRNQPSIPTQASRFPGYYSTMGFACDTMPLNSTGSRGHFPGFFSSHRWHMQFTLIPMVCWPLLHRVNGFMWHRDPKSKSGRTAKSSSRGTSTRLIFIRNLNWVGNSHVSVPCTSKVTLGRCLLHVLLPVIIPRLGPTEVTEPRSAKMTGYFSLSIWQIGRRHIYSTWKAWSLYVGTYQENLPFFMLATEVENENSFTGYGHRRWKSLMREHLEQDYQKGVVYMNSKGPKRTSTVYHSIHDEVLPRAIAINYLCP